MQNTLWKSSIPLAGAALALTVTACGNPNLPSGTRIGQATIEDYYTLRTFPDGSIGPRDLAPTPRPREAITTDDYFGIKLEHLYMGDMGRDVGNLAIIAAIDGIIPEGVRCSMVPETDLGFHLSEQQSDNASMQSGGCAFKSIVQVNPVFSDAHATFDSVFITPPFRTGREELNLHFIMAQINDFELARQIVDWAEERTDQLTSADVLNVNSWQEELINIGFSAVNYLLDYASQPTYVFEMTTEFIPVETVEGAEPQSLLMGGDFVVVGIPENSPLSGGVLHAADELIYTSGRLYWARSRDEYRDSPYIVFNIVRFSRYPGDLPLNLPQINRAVRRGMSPEEVTTDARNLILDLQDSRILNETEGEMLLDLFEWYAEAATMAALLEENEYTEDDIPMAWSDVPPATIAAMLPLPDLHDAADLMRQLQSRIYDNYGQTPGLTQEECVTLTALTQDLAEANRSVLPDVLSAFENLQIYRHRLQTDQGRSEDEEAEYSALMRVEPEMQDMILAIPGCAESQTGITCDFDAYPEPACPAMREAYIPE